MEWVLILIAAFTIIIMNAAIYTVYNKKKRLIISSLQADNPSIEVYAARYQQDKLLNLNKAKLTLQGNKAIIKTASSTAEFDLPATTVTTGDLVHWGKILLTSNQQTWWVEPFNFSSQFFFVRTLFFRKTLLLSARDAIVQSLVKHGVRT